MMHPFSALKQETEKFTTRQPPIGKKMIMIIKTNGFQMGSPAAAEGGREARGGGRGGVER